MADLLLGVSQSSLLLLQPRLALPGRAYPPRSYSNISYQRLVISSKRIAASGTVAGAVSSEFQSSTVVTDSVDSINKGIEIEPDIGGGGGSGGEKFGGGGGGDGGGGDSKDDGEGDSKDESGKEKKMAMSMSQKLTLGYAALVGGDLPCSSLPVTLLSFLIVLMIGNLECSLGTSSSYSCAVDFLLQVIGT